MCGGLDLGICGFGGREVYLGFYAVPQRGCVTCGLRRLAGCCDFFLASASVVLFNLGLYLVRLLLPYLLFTGRWYSSQSHGAWCSIEYQQI